MSTERIGIELEVEGYESALRKIQEIQRQTETFRGKNARIEFQGNWDTVENHIRRLKQSIAALKNEKVTLLKDGDTSGVKRVNQELRIARQNLNMLQTASQNAGKSLKSTFNSVSSQIAHLGGALQSAGNALTRFAAPMQMLFGGSLFAAGYGLVNKVTSGLASGFGRYDTMKKYPLVMQAFGYSTEQAQESIDALDKSVRGLPTGLNEIIDMAQRFTATTGDISKGTQLAIAANNAFLASMATETQQYQGMMQLQDVLGGKDMNAREWNSLVSSMTPAIVKMGESLGYTNENMSEFIQMIRDGKMANQDFIDTLIKVGTGEGSVAKMAELSKSTWEAVSRNIGNAFSRMAAKALEAFDKISEIATGKTLVKYLAEDLIPLIDKVTASLIQWIDKHQGDILNFFKELKRIDIGSLVKGYIGGLRDLYDLTRKFVKLISGKDVSWLGRLFALAGPAGTFLTIGGGLIKGLRQVIAGFYTLVRALKEGAALGFLKTLFGLGQGSGAAGTAAKKATEGINNWKGFLKSIAGAASLLANVAMIGGAGVVAFKSVKTMLKDLKEIIGISSEIDWSAAKEILLAMGAFFTSFGAIGIAVGSLVSTATMLEALAGTAFIGAITAIVGAFGALDTWLVKKAVQNIRDIVAAIGDAINLAKDLPNTSGISTKLRDAVDGIMQIYSSFQSSTEQPGLSDISVDKAKGFVNRLEPLKDSLKLIKQSADYIAEMSNMPDVSGAKENIANVLDVIVSIYTQAKEAFTENGVFFSYINGSWSKRLAEVFTSLEKMFSGIDGIYAILRERQWTALDTMIGKTGKTRAEKVVGVVDQLIDMYIGIKKSLTTKSEWLGLDTVDSESSTNIATLLSNLETVFQAIDSIYELIRVRDWTAFDKVIDSSGNNRIDKLKEVFASIKGVYDEIVSNWGESGFSADRSGEVSTIMDNILNVIRSFDSIYELVRVRDWTNGFADKMKNIGGMILSLNFLKLYLPGLMGMNIEGASAKIDQITNVVKSIVGLSEASKSAEGIDLNDLVASLKELIPQISEIGKEISEGFVDSIDFKAMEKKLRDGMNSLLSVLNGYKEKFRTKARAIGQSFKTTLQSELSNVSVTTSVTVTITNAIIHGLSVVENAIQEGVDSFKRSYEGPTIHSSQGGPVYLSDGGSVFKARGTDIIPAMLTRGEYVQNRHAVAMFGKAFMDRVNALDVDGAMKALHTRFGAAINNSRSSTINNVINNNNNQQMTQNVYTNNPKFAKIRSNRYVGAL